MSDLRRKIQTPNLPPIPDVGTSLANAADSQRPTARKHDYSPLEWTDFFDSKDRVETKDRGEFNVYRKGNDGLVLLLLHGGGYTGLTWACLAEEIYSTLKCQIIAPDLRGHGESVGADFTDYSSDAFVQDIVAIIHSLFKDAAPPVMVIGHSHRSKTEIVKNNPVIPEFNEILLECHKKMEFEADRIPSSIKSGTVRYPRSARVSMPSQLKSDSNSASQSGQLTELPESSEEDDFKTPTSYSWRTDLFKTEPYWTDWFSGLSEKFLATPVPKILILAGVNRLDKSLTVGQMQGKFQMVVLPKCGHAVQEDSPMRVAEVIATFCVRNKFSESKINSVPQQPKLIP